MTLGRRSMPSMLEPILFAAAAFVILCVAALMRANLAAHRMSPENVRRSALAFARSKLQKNGLSPGQIDAALLDAIVEDAIMVATRARRTDMVLVDEHIQTLLRLAARAERGFAAGGIEDRLWKRVSRRAEVLRL